MQLVLVFLHIVVCVALIMIVLLQKGKGASMGAAFGGSSQTIFGSAGATPFLHKICRVHVHISRSRHPFWEGRDILGDERGYSHPGSRVAAG